MYPLSEPYQGQTKCSETMLSCKNRLPNIEIGSMIGKDY